MQLLPSLLMGTYFALLFGLVAGCSGSEAPDDEVNPVQEHATPRIMAASEALSGAHIPTLDPATMSDAEIWKGIGEGAHCTFRYTSSGKPVLAVKALPDGGAEGVVKLNGHLVILRSASVDGDFSLKAGEVRVTLAPDRDPEAKHQVEAAAVFEVDGRLRVGYRGYYGCAE